MSGLYDIIAERYGDPAAFVRRLRSTMLLHGITQGQLCRKSGYQRPNVSRWLSGDQRPSLQAMVTLDEAIDSLVAAHHSNSRAA